MPGNIQRANTEITSVFGLLALRGQLSLRALGPALAVHTTVEKVQPVPGHISRSVLTDRLRRLADLGLVSRANEDGQQQQPYRLTLTGQGLVPTLLALRSWADDWLPDDPAAVERDPEIILGWLAERVAVDHLPERQTILELTMRHAEESHSWIVLEAGSQPFGCLEDPLLDESRYVHIEAGVSVLMSLARGRRDWSEALSDGSVQAFGDPRLVEHLPEWFRPAGAERRAQPLIATSQLA